MRNFILIVVLPVICNAQQIATDRPDQTESTELVPKNLLQLESGFVHEKTKEITTQIPTLLLKYGINDFIELRFQTDYKITKFENQKLKGFSALTFGVKGKITPESDTFPAISVLMHFSYGKWASKEYQTDQWSSDFRLLFNHSLSDHFSLGYNLGAEWNNNGEEFRKLYTLAFNYSMTDKLGLFIESYGFYETGKSADNRIDYGLTYLPSNNFQIDASSGVGLSFASPNCFFSLGFSYRFPLSK